MSAPCATLCYPASFCREFTKDPCVTATKVNNECMNVYEKLKDDVKNLPQFRDNEGVTERISRIVEGLKDGVSDASNYLAESLLFPDHVTVIIAVSKIDEALNFLITQRLMPCPSKDDEFLESERGVGTFSNRIELAFRLGVIDSSLARALHLMRKIRNDFAHSSEEQKLEKSPHLDRINELIKRCGQDSRAEKVGKVLAGVSANLSDAKIDFGVVTVLVLARLNWGKVLVTQVDSTVAKAVTFP